MPLVFAFVLALAQIVEFHAEDDGDKAEQRQALRCISRNARPRPHVGGERFFVLLDGPLAAVRIDDLAVANQHRVGEQVAGFSLGQQRENLIAAAEFIEDLNFTLNPFRARREGRADDDEEAGGDGALRGSDR